MAALEKAASGIEQGKPLRGRWLQATEDLDAFRATVAASFATAEQVLHESHANALRLIEASVDCARRHEQAGLELKQQVRQLGAAAQQPPPPPPLHDEPELLPQRLPSGLLASLRGHTQSRDKLAWAQAKVEALRAPGVFPPTPASADSSASILPGCLSEIPQDEDDASPVRTSSLSGPQTAQATLARHDERSGTGSFLRRVQRAISGQSTNGVLSTASAASAARDHSRKPSVNSHLSKKSEASQQHNYEMHAIWTKEPVKKKKKREKLRRGNTSDSISSFSSYVHTLGADDTSGGCRTRLVLDPNSMKRAAWDIGGVVLVIYDMVMIPLQLFDLPETGFTRFLIWITRIWWTWDIVMSFFTGIVNREGAIDKRFCPIARNYLASWFAVDALIVGSDWVEVLWSDGSFLGFARAGKATRTFRIIRMIRLLRLARVRNVFNMLTERIQSEQLVLVAGMLNIMLVIMGLSHIIACVWYGIAVDRQDSWLVQHGFQDASLGMKYSTALHWSLLQFAGGTDEIVPQNVDERLYAVSVFLLAFVMAAVFVGRLTSSMTQLHMLSKKDTEKFQALKKYLLKNEISGPLTMRVMHNAQHALLESQRFMEEARVELLGILSEPVRTEVHFELYEPVLAVHPFFRCFTDGCPQVARKVCHTAMAQQLVSNGDVVFTLGEVPIAPRMLIVCSGQFSYAHANGAVTFVEAGQCICEATLWTPWVHRGTLKASKDCRLCTLDSARFQHLADSYDHNFNMRIYARAFVYSLNSGEIDNSDLPFCEDAAPGLMEAIAALGGQKENHNETVQRPALTTEGSSPFGKWRRSGTMSSSGSSEASGASRGALEDSGKRRSVLMVMPRR